MNEDGLGWMCKDKRVSVHQKYIEEATWSRVGHLYELAIFTEDDTFRFIGFQEKVFFGAVLLIG